MKKKIFSIISILIIMTIMLIKYQDEIVSYALREEESINIKEPTYERNIIISKSEDSKDIGEKENNIVEEENISTLENEKMLSDDKSNEDIKVDNKNNEDDINDDKSLNIFCKPKQSAKNPGQEPSLIFSKPKENNYTTPEEKIDEHDTKKSISVAIEDKGNLNDLIKINLISDKEEIQEIILSDSNEWKYTFDSLPVYNVETKEEIVYEISKEKIEGYTSTISGDLESGFTISMSKEEKDEKEEDKDTVSDDLTYREENSNNEDNLNNEKSPNTGDEDIFLFLIIAILSLICISYLASKRSNIKNNV